MSQFHSSRRHRRRSGRIRRRVLRRRPRHEGHARRSGAEPGRRLPVSRLHPVQGAAARRRVVNEAKHADAWGVTLRRADDRHRQGCAASRTRSSTQLTGGVGQVVEAAQDRLHPGHRGVPRRAARSRSPADGTASTLELLRARDHRHRLAAGDGARAVDRQPARDGLDRRRSTCRTSRSRCWSSAAATSASSSAASTPRSASKVTVVEMTDGLLPGADRDLVNILAKRIDDDLRGGAAQHQGRRR